MDYFRKNRFGSCLIFIVVFALLFLTQGYFIVGFLSNFIFERVTLTLLVTYVIWCLIIYKPTKCIEVYFKYRWRINVALIILFTALQLHGSSINIYDSYVQPNYYVEDAQNIYGDSRGMRSDEWAFQTPMNISQSETNSSYINDYVRATNTDMYAVVRAPVKSIVTLGTYFNIGFLTGNANIGLSFWWNSRLFLLIGFTIEFFYVLTNKNKVLSLFGAVLIAFSPALTWWFSTSVVDQYVAGAAAIVFTYYFLNSKDKIKKILFALAFWISLLNYGFSMYLATLVPLTYMYLPIFIWVIYNNRRKLDKYDFIGILSGLILFVITCYIFIKSSSEAISLIMDTVYPGKRLFNEESSRINLSFLHWTSPLLSNSEIIVNPSEFSSLITFLPITIVLMIYNVVTKKADKLMISLFLIGIFYVIVQYVDLPSSLASLLLFNFTTRLRIRLVCETIFVILLILLLNQKRETKHAIPKYVFGLALILNFVMTAIAIEKHSKILLNPITLNLCLLLLLFVILSVLYTFSFTNNIKFKKYFIIITSVFALFSFAIVNPVVKGSAVFSEKDVASFIKNEDENDQGKWLVVDSSFVVNNYVLAQGVHVINSTNYYPNFELLKKLDPNEKYMKVYNRYAHVIYEFTDSNTYFKLNYDDAYTVHLNPKDLKKLEVKYIYSSTKVAESVLVEINGKEIYNKDGVYIYKIRGENYE